MGSIISLWTRACETRVIFFQTHTHISACGSTQLTPPQRSSPTGTMASVKLDDAFSIERLSRLPPNQRAEYLRLQEEANRIKMERLLLQE